MNRNLTDRTSFKKILIGATLIALITGSIYMMYLFRSETIDNPSLGVIQYSYHWGKRTGMTIDANRDGRVDLRGVTDEFGFPTEYWEDGDGDGKLERHVITNGDAIERVELDKDGDGKYEVVLTGDAAHNFYASLQVSSSPRATLEGLADTN